MNWTSGYVTDVGYTHGFYRELTPAILNFAALCQGYAAPCSDGKSTKYLELGCGQGFSTNLLAAANPHVEFTAADFNPSQINGAQRLAAAAGTQNVQFLDHSFEQMLSEPGLPDFDIISFHGIYSWISEANRKSIVRIVAERLKPGGLVYLSYNTMPGWTQSLALRRLLVDHAQTLPGSRVRKIEAALAYAKKLQDAGAQVFTANPQMGERLKQFLGQPKEYLAHELFNRDWTPFYFADVAAELAEAKLTFVASAHMLDHLDVLNLTPEQVALLAEIDDPVMREGCRDLVVNQQFRRDVFIKGPVSLGAVATRDRWVDLRFALSSRPADVPRTIKTSRGDAQLQAEIYDPVLAAFDGAPRTVKELTSRPELGSIPWASLRQALMVLVGAGRLQPAHPAKIEADARKKTAAFNLAVMNRARDGGELNNLASPVTGSGVLVDRISQLFLLAMKQKTDDLPLFVWNTLSEMGQRIIKDGKPIETAEDNLAELRTRLEAFQREQLPVLKTLLIA